MNQFKFKTNIKCTGCLSKVQPVLDAEEQIEKWDVDLQNDDRVLTVEVKDMEIEEVKQKLAKVGFNAEEISV